MIGSASPDPKTNILNKIIEEDEKISFHEFSQSSPDKDSMEDSRCSHGRSELELNKIPLFKSEIINNPNTKPMLKLRKTLSQNQIKEVEFEIEEPEILTQLDPEEMNLG